MQVKNKLESAKICLEIIEALFEYYLERWKKRSSINTMQKHTPLLTKKLLMISMVVS